MEPSALLAGLILIWMGILPVRFDSYDDALPPGAKARFGTLRLRVGAPVDSLAVSPDGQFIACTNRRGKLFVFDTPSGKRRSLLDDDEFLTDATFSLNSEILAYSRRHEVMLLDPRSGRSKGTLPALEGAYSLCFSPDSRLLAAVVGSDGAVRVWAVEDRKETGFIPARQIRAITFAPDAKTLATANSSGLVELWDTANWQRKGKFQTRQGWFRQLAYSPTGEYLASAGLGTGIRLWKAPDAQLVWKKTDHDKPMEAIVFHPDGHSLISCSEDDTIRSWDIRSGKELFRLETPGFRPNSLAIARRGDFLFAGSESGVIRRWNLKRKTAADPVPPRLPVRCLLFDRERNLFATGSETQILIWNVSQAEPRRSLGPHPGACWLSPSLDGKKVAAAGFDGKVRVWDVASEREVLELEHGTGPVYTIAFSPDGTLLASGGFDAKIRFCDARTGNPLKVLSKHTSFVVSVAFSPDGRLLASCGSDGGDETIRLWEVQSGKQVYKRKLKGFCRSLAFSPDGKILAAACQDNLIRLLSSPDGTEIRVLKGHGDAVQCVQFSPDGKMLASCSQDHSVRLWDVATGKGLLRREGHIGWVNCVAFSPDGKELASGSDDTTMLVWDLSGLEKMKKKKQ
jgi:WD40 repeat protein